MTYYHQEALRIRDQHFPKPHIADHVAAARRFIDENFGEDIDLQTISQFSFFSKYHFIRLFSKCYGVTPHDYLTERRMEVARNLILSGRTVTETCFEIGFSSPNSFTAIFKKCTGLSPTAYKKQFSIGPSEASTAILPLTKSAIVCG
jgi:AraC-like DNA-binding protein